MTKIALKKKQKLQCKLDLLVFIGILYRHVKTKMRNDSVLIPESFAHAF